jgi:argininosuccinate synthase
MASSKKKDSSLRLSKKKVVLAYSGGLDTSVAIRWLQDNYDLDVVAVSIDVGQPGDMEKNIERARTIGAVAAYALDAREEFAESYVWPSLKANALYQGIYPLSTAIARPLIAKLLVEVARKEGAEYIAVCVSAFSPQSVHRDS